MYSNLFFYIGRYILCLPLAFVACQIVWQIVLFIWKWFHVISQPITTNFLFRIEFLENVSYFVDKITFVTISTSTGIFAFYFSLNYLIPKNAAKSIIIKTICTIMCLLLTYHLITLADNWERYEDIIMVILSIASTLFVTKKNNDIKIEGK